MTPAHRLSFRYTNHRGEDHIYLLEPSGLNYEDEHWVITGICLERDGKSRRGHGEVFPFRTFKLAEMRDITEIPT